MQHLSASAPLRDNYFAEVSAQEWRPETSTQNGGIFLNCTAGALSISCRRWYLRARTGNFAPHREPCGKTIPLRLGVSARTSSTQSSGIVLNCTTKGVTVAVCPAARRRCHFAYVLQLGAIAFLNTAFAGKAPSASRHSLYPRSTGGVRKRRKKDEWRRFQPPPSSFRFCAWGISPRFKLTSATHSTPRRCSKGGLIWPVAASP
jgi:hypothetical protein